MEEETGLRSEVEKTSLNKEEVTEQEEGEEWRRYMI